MDKPRHQLSLVGKRSKRPGQQDERQLRVIGLFAGIGGIELGLSEAGHETSLLCEIDEGAKAVLRTRFPSPKLVSDVCEIDRLPDDVELITAGFPCQDLSQAGRTEGIEGSKSGLVGEIFRLIERNHVPHVLLENVPFMLQLAKGKALEVIIARFEALGYKWAYRVVNSRGFGVPQRRERVYLYATLDGDPRDVLLCDDEGDLERETPDLSRPLGFYWTEGIRGWGAAVDSVPTLKGGSTIGIPSPPAILMPHVGIVKPDIRDAERMQGFEEDWTLPAEEVTKRGHRWKLVGNAVTVNVARWIGHALASPGSYDTVGDVPLPDGSRWPSAAWNVGEGRFVARVSAFPKKEIVGLDEFLKHPGDLLSERATAGFLERARRGSLRFPPGFLDRVEAHLERMTDAPRRAII